MNKRYVVRLADGERPQLEELVSKGKAAAQKIKHAKILLKADADGEGWTDEDIAGTFLVHPNTVRGIRQRFVEEGLESALNRKRRALPPRERILDGEKEARLIALSCSKPPEGFSRWSLRLLADQVVELDYIDSISHESIRLILKKTNLSHGRTKDG